MGLAAKKQHSEPPWRQLERGSEPLVYLLWKAGFQTFNGCSGGSCHRYKYPAVEVCAPDEELEITSNLIEIALLDAGLEDFWVSVRRMFKDKNAGVSNPQVVVEWYGGVMQGSKATKRIVQLYNQFAVTLPPQFEEQAQDRCVLVPHPVTRIPHPEGHQSVVWWRDAHDFLDAEIRRIHKDERAQCAKIIETAAERARNMQELLAQALKDVYGG